jgi:hypothetical protein
MYSTQDTSLLKACTFQQKRSIFYVRLSGGHGSRGGSRRGILLLLFLRSLNRGSRGSGGSSRCLDRGSWRSRSSNRRGLGLGRLGGGSFGGWSGVGLGGFSSGSRSCLCGLGRLGDNRRSYRLHLSLGFGGLLSRGAKFSCNRCGSWLSGGSRRSGLSLGGLGGGSCGVGGLVLSGLGLSVLLLEGGLELGLEVVKSVQRNSRHDGCYGASI